MPGAVVHVLEEVDINQDQREGLAGFLPPGPTRFKALAEGAAIGRCRSADRLTKGARVRRFVGGTRLELDNQFVALVFDPPCES